MRNLIFIDTETTGKEQEDRLCQFAYKHYLVSGEDVMPHDELNELYLPPQKIGFEAMSVHHITNEMVAGKPTFAKNDAYSYMQKLFDDPETVVVAHNIAFDAKMLAKEGIAIRNQICTLKIARHLDPEGKLANHKLQYLRYALGLNVKGAAHDAMGDVNVLEALFKRLQKKVAEDYLIPFPIVEDYLKEMMRLTDAPVLIPRFAFGKHKGKLIADVAKSDKGYLRWLLGSEKEKGEEADADMMYTLKKYL